MKTTKWALDPTHSEINFKLKHMMITNVSGSFGKFDITAATEGDGFANATIDFSADVNSISTNNADRDTHLKSPDFFDAASFPTIQFKATKFENGKLTGDLTMHGVTKPVDLEVESGGVAKDPWGNIKAGFSISGKVNRKDWGLNWNAALETGGILVGEEVKIAAEIQLVKQA